MTQSKPVERIPRLILGAPGRSSGKTTIAMGLLYAFEKRGLTPQPFKKGPDYIDPTWLTATARRVCRNLDFHMMGAENIMRSFQTACVGAGIAVIEGNMGLYDGLDLEGADSTAGLAHLLRAPVVMVINCHGMNRGVAPLLAGYTQFDTGLEFGGVILNKVASPRHETKLRRAIERYTSLKVLGAAPKSPDEIAMTERHLGLIPVKENPELAGKALAIASAIEKNLDIDSLVDLAKAGGELPTAAPCPSPSRDRDIRIGVAMDRAFNFYYPENLSALESAGAQIVPFSPLSDPALPEVDGLYIGGGFPEIFIEELEANEPMRHAVKSAVDSGVPVYAECGGLMYLSRYIQWGNRRGAMAGAIDCGVEMTKRPMGLGYMTLKATGQCGWFNPEGEVHCHEFHHSRLVGLGKKTRFAWKVLRGSGVGGGFDGITIKNTLASYAHIHACGAPGWADNFASSCAGQTSGKVGCK